MKIHEEVKFDEDLIRLISYPNDYDDRYHVVVYYDAEWIGDGENSCWTGELVILSSTCVFGDEAYPKALKNYSELVLALFAREGLIWDLYCSLREKK